VSVITVELTKAERKQVISDAAQLLSDRLYDESSMELRLISKARAAGLLDVDPKTLEKLGVPRVCLSDSKLVKYLASDIAEFIASRRER